MRSLSIVTMAASLLIALPGAVRAESLDAEEDTATTPATTPAATPATTPAATSAPTTSKGAPDLAGPRIGLTYIMSPNSDDLDQELGINPVISQFGWQFEHHFFKQPGGFSGLNEFVFLLGGLDQATIAPVASWVLGVRSAGGTEFGGGPVLSFAEMFKAMKDGNFGLGKTDSGKQLAMAGVGFALAAGVTLESGGIHFPFNLVFVRSKTYIDEYETKDGEMRGGEFEPSYRLSLLVGFTLSNNDD